MSEKMLIRHCSPTLAGIKTGNLFSCEYESTSEVIEYLRNVNRKLKSKGLRALPLKFTKSRVLIYVYRPERLSKDLSSCMASEILNRRGYNTPDTDGCIIHLMSRLRESEEFPHEIGLFLGYPPEDVSGFIENKPGSCKYTGLWKVYGNVESALRLFEQYKKCTDVYSRQWADGKTLERLAVSSISRRNPA